MNKNTLIKSLIIAIVISLIAFHIPSTGIITTTKTTSARTISSQYGCGKPLGFGEDPWYVMEITPPLPPAAGASPPLVILDSFPPQFSWKNNSGADWTTPAKSQGACGSCWDFAAVGALESMINIGWEDPDLDLDLSEQYVLSCLSAAGSCAGGGSDLAFYYIKSTSPSGNYYNGIIPETCFPYQADSNIPCSEKCPEWKEKLVPILNYSYWNPSYPEDRDLIKTQIMENGPIVTYVYATSDFAEFWSNTHDPEDYYPYVEATTVNHAVVLLGWKDDPAIETGGYWICKNSWGTSWGYDGFFNIAYGSLNIDNYFITWVLYEPYQSIGLNITTPQQGRVYLLGNEIFSFLNIPHTMVIVGPITVQVVANDFIFGIERVEFRLSDSLLYTDYESPYECQINTPRIGIRTLRVTAYNNNGENSTREIHNTILLCLGLF